MTHPRINLLRGPTPMYRLARLSEHLGLDLFIKRDDLAGTTLGGNKVRQLEYYLGAALAERADTILITGAVQSNFVRTAAACANSLGLRTIVQLENRVPGQDDAYQSSGNVLLSRMYRAEIITYPEGEDEDGADAALRARAEEERQKGYRPYVIPLATGNPPLGALGYVRAAQEIATQEHAGFDAVIVGTGSGLTHAGLLAGFDEAGAGTRVIGSCVRRSARRQHDRITGVLEATALLRDQPAVPAERIEVWDGALAPGYGMIGSKAAQAIRLMAQHEGLVLDPVYTAKAFAAIPGLLEEGRLKQGNRVLFVHTGGLAALFAYQAEILRVVSDGEA